MTLRKQYNKLEKDIHDEYQRLINIGDYDILTKTINEFYDDVSDEIFEMLDDEGIEEAIINYNILDCLEQIYYNNRRGEERLCYLLGAEKKSGLYVYDDVTSQTMFISFSDLNGVLQEIIVIEAIQK